MILNTTISGNLQGILADKFKQAARNIKAVCKQNNLPARICNTLIEDVAMMQQNCIFSMRLSYDDIEQIAPIYWEPATPFLGCVLRTYGQLNGFAKYIERHPEATIDLRSGRHEIVDDLGEKHNISVLAVYEFYKRHGGATDEELQTLKEGAAVFIHAWTTTIFLELLKNGEKRITAEDLLPIAPYECNDHTRMCMLSLNDDALFAAYMHKHIEVAEETKERWEKKGIATHRFVKTIGNALQKIDEKSKKSRKRDSAQVLNMMQNTAELLSKSINTADTTECGQAGIPRPLLQAIQEKKDAGADVATITYITQAIRGAAIIADTWKPIADGKEKATYCDTLLNITKIITGQDNPVKSQIEETWRALRFLSTQQLEFTEYISVASMPKRRGRPRKAAAQAPQEMTPAQQAAAMPMEVEIETEGKKIRYEAVKVLTNPLTATFRTPLKENEEFSGSTEVTLDIHHIITEGRRADKLQLPNGKWAYIKKPVGHLAQMQQIYAWTTPAEIRFYGIMLAKSHMKESEMLKDINDYETKMMICTTDEEKKKMKRSRQNHMGRDREALQDMFIKAKEVGLIAWYSRTEAVTYTTEKKEYVWKWGRPAGTTTK